MHDEIAANRRISDEKIAKGESDVFLSYGVKDREQAKTLGVWLRDNGITAWLKDWHLQPGLPSQEELEREIERCKAAAVCVSKTEVDAMQKMEIAALLQVNTIRSRPIIPVFLEKAPFDTKLSLFLSRNTAVDFRIHDLDPLTQIILGITGQRPSNVYRPGILVATLGESPVVVSSMVRLLTEREKLTIDQVAVLVPGDEDVQLAYKQVQEALTDVRELHRESLDFKDADTWRNACTFLQRLYRLLGHYEKQGETVYLSLAGGRKSMAALMAWVVPYFSCVRKLYHVIDKNEEQFISSARLNTVSAAKRTQLMRPDIDQLTLVDIPFEREPKINNDLFTRLLRASEGTYEEMEALIAGQTIIQEDTILKVEVTKRVMEQFSALRKTNTETAQTVRNMLLSLSNIEKLREYESYVESYSDKVPKLGRLTFYRLKQGPIRPIFYTTPDAIFPSTKSYEVEKMIICSLETTSEQQALKQIVTETDFPKTPNASIDALAPIPSPAESVLIVPLGKMPMVVTQLYTLLKEEEKRTIREVVLIYPERSVEIDNAARIIKDALWLKDKMPCTLARVAELDDITSAKDCTKCQATLEAEIERVQKEYPNECHIDLALSGGRKGMTAMTIFAAQRNNIPYVYHTLVTNEALSEKIDEETTVKALKKSGISEQERLNRLFLRAYNSEDPNNPYANFVLFRVPIFSEQNSVIAGV